MTCPLFLGEPMAKEESGLGMMDEPGKVIWFAPR